MKDKLLCLCVISCSCLQASNECSVAHFGLGVSANDLHVPGLTHPLTQLLLTGLRGNKSIYSKTFHHPMQFKFFHVTYILLKHGLS